MVIPIILIISILFLNLCQFPQMSFSRELKSAVPKQWNSAHSIYISLDKVHYRCYESKTKTHIYLFIQEVFS